VDIKKCRRCNSENLKFRERKDTIHYGEMFCGHCNCHCQWVSNPDSSRKNNLRVNKKVIKEICEFHRMKEEFCFFCLRKRDQLGLNETLTIDHIHELDKGGDDQVWNMQILCMACHKLKDWCRLYMNWHYIKEQDENTE